MLGSLSAAAQVSVYNFQNVSGTYAPLGSGATAFAINGGAGFDGDDAYSAPIGLPFSFPLGSFSANTVIVNSNGFIGLGGSANSTNFNVDMFPNAATFYNHTIAFAGVDLKNTATVYRWIVDGTAPNRIWKMEAGNFDRFNGIGQTGSAQVWLYESGQIDLVYGTFSNLWDPANLSFEVGLRGSGPTDVLTLGGSWAAPGITAGATTIATSQNSIPTPGQTFRFTVSSGTDITPPTIGAVTLTPPAPSCTAQAHTVSITPTDDSGIASAVITYAVGTGSNQTVAMTNNSGTWSGTIPAQGTSTVTYSVTVTDASAQANQSTSPTASYADAQTQVDAGANVTIATGQTTILTATNAVTGAPVNGPVTWSGGLLTGTVTANPFTTPQHPSAGTYTYTASFDANGCITTDTVVVTVIPATTPVAAFVASTTTAAVGQPVTFTDQSTNLPDSWQWSFSPSTVTFVGGTSATSQNPQVTFNGAGCYTVSLTATNGAGSDTETKTSYVCAALAYCTTNLQQNACTSFGNYINSVSIATTPLDNLNTGCNSNSGNSYVSWPASGATTASLMAGQTYTLTVTTNSVGTTAAWLDYNANGQFETNEFILVQASGPANQPASATFTVPGNTPGGDVLLRIRNGGLANSITAADACVLRFTGETEDYTVTLQAGCPNPPTAGFSYPGTANGVCHSSGLTLTPQLATGATAGTFSTNFPGLVLDAATGAIDVTNSQAGNYTIYNTVAASGACPAALDSTIITIEDPRSYEVVAIDSATICPGTSAPLEVREITGEARAHRVNSTSYQWLFNGQPISGANSVGYAASQAGIYTVIVTTSAGCVDTADALTITVLPAQSAAFHYGTNNTVCIDGITQLTPTISGTPGGTFLAPSLTIDPGTGTIDLSMPPNGTYEVIYTTPGPCAETDTVLLTLTPQPIVAFTYPAATICAGGPDTLQAQIAPDATPGDYSATPAGLTIDENTGTIIGATSAAGVYTITSTVAAGGGCPAVTATFTLTVSPTASAAFSYSGNTICLSATTNPTPTVTGTAGGTFSVTPTGLTVDPATGAIDLSASTAGTYTVTYTVANSCGTSSSDQTLTLTTAPTAAFSYPLTAPCAGSNGTLTPALAVGASAGTFSATPTGLTIDPATGLVDLATSAAGVYTVTNTLAPANGCAGAIDSATLVIEALPVVGVAVSGPLTFCDGDSVVLTASGGSVFQWSSGQNTAGIVVRQSGDFVVTVLNNAGCSATSDTISVVVTPRASAAFSYGAASYCLGGTNPSPVVTGTAGGTFSSTTGLIIDGTTGAIDLMASNAGTYTVTYTVAGTCGAASTQTVTLTPAPTAGFVYDNNVACAGAAGTLNVNIAPGATLGTFTATPAGLTIDAATGAVNPATSQPGIYTVTNTVTGTGGCGDATATTTVTIEATPAQPTFTAVPQGSGIVILTSSSATGNQWFLNGVLITGATNQTYTVTSAAQNGTYTLQVTNGNCTSPLSDPQTLTITGTAADALAQLIQLYPNPTLDGLVTVELPAANAATPLTIFDAAGRVVFRTTLVAGIKQAQLDLHHLTTGVYAVKVGTTVRRLVRD